MSTVSTQVYIFNYSEFWSELDELMKWLRCGANVKHEADSIVGPPFDAGPTRSVWAMRRD